MLILEFPINRYFLQNVFNMSSFSRRMEMYEESYLMSKKTPAYRELKTKYKALKKAYKELVQRAVFSIHATQPHYNPNPVHYESDDEEDDDAENGMISTPITVKSEPNAFPESNDDDIVIIEDVEDNTADYVLVEDANNDDDDDEDSEFIEIVDMLDIDAQICEE